MKVIDNFLEENDFIKIQNKFLSETCKWEWSNVVENDNSFYNFQFVHGVYLPTVLLKKGYDPEDIFRKITIPEMPDIKPLLESLKTSAIIKIKVNLTTKTPTIIEHGFHIDHFFPKAKTAILYLNTCDGYTLFSNGSADPFNDFTLVGNSHPHAVDLAVFNNLSVTSGSAVLVRTYNSAARVAFTSEL